MRTKRASSRRRFLRGSGVVVALPFLETQATDKHAFARKAEEESQSAENESPMRMVCIGLEYGLYPTDFFPKETGRLGELPNRELPNLLRPLETLKQDITVFSGLDHPGIQGGHFVTHTFLSGIKSSQANAHSEGNITVDQKAAEKVGRKTRFPSMQLGLGGGGVSWTRNGVAIPPITRLQSFFDVLFLETPRAKKEQVSRLFEINRSILDVVHDDAAALKRRLNRSDLDKLDEYFSSIREVEKRLVQSEAWLGKAKPEAEYRLPNPPPGNFYGEVPLFYDLMRIALQTDSTRVLSMAINGWRGSSGLPGVTKGYHDITHHGRDKKKLEQLSIIETFHTSQFARLLDSLKQTQASPDCSLLDRTMVLFGSGLGNASSHSNRNLPMILAGGGFAHGAHKSYSDANGKSTPACNLFLSMLERFGVETDQFGTSTGTLEGLG